MFLESILDIPVWWDMDSFPFGVLFPFFRKTLKKTGRMDVYFVYVAWILFEQHGKYPWPVEPSLPHWRKLG